MRSYSKQTFSATIDGKDYNFFCHTSDTKDGFCHTCWCPELEECSSRPSTTRISYYNRTWESFEYECVLRRAIEKFPKNLQQPLTDILIHKKTIEVHERCEKEIEQFKRLHAGLTDKQKELLAQAPPMQTEEDMHRTMGIMGIFNVFNQMSASN